jgi:hypothetical protein
MIEKTAADPRLVAAIRAHRAALAGASVPRRVARPPVVTTPRTPTPTPTPPSHDPTPASYTGITAPTGGPFSATAAAQVYANRQRVEHASALSRVRALAPADDPRPVPTEPVPVPVRWPDPAEVYERRKADVRRAQLRRDS